jgi:hypothetical protein
MRGRGPPVGAVGILCRPAMRRPAPCKELGCRIAISNENSPFSLERWYCHSPILDGANHSKKAFKLSWQRLKSTRNEESTSSKPSQIGLRTLVEPSHDSSTSPLNIVFVHGLGGSAEGTWTDSQNNSFWPPWLTKLAGLGNARIMTFGYDSGWNEIWKPNNVLDVSDFAKQLANDLWCHYSDHGDVFVLL